jgi:ubiquinone/menaquinone biosynthesis C-methylase UbiE
LRARATQHLCLQAGHCVADVGCGPGTFTNELSRLIGDRGHVLGIDRNAEMIGAARASRVSGATPAVTYLVADCTALPLGDATLDGYYGERLLQHLHEPGPSTAISEALRVLKPGGHLVVADTDWTTLSIYSDEPLLAERVAAAYRSRFRNPSSGRRLAQLLADAAAANVTTEAFVVSLASETSTGVSTASAHGALLRRTLSRSERRQWLASMARARAAGQPYGQVTITLAAATRRLPAG